MGPVAAHQYVHNWYNFCADWLYAVKASIITGQWVAPCILSNSIKRGFLCCGASLDCLSLTNTKSFYIIAINICDSHLIPLKQNLGMPVENTHTSIVCVESPNLL